MKTEFSDTAKVDVISELSKATGLAECTLFGITSAGFTGIKSPKKQEIELQNRHQTHSINK
jgi:hypothetical protein